MFTPTLTVDLTAIVANWRLLKERFTGKECAAVVKANAYGLGVGEVAPALAKAGCGQFFVATLEEGIALRALLAHAQIGVFHGPYAGEEKDYLAHRLLPVINTSGQLERWLKLEVPYALHVDTGMNRLGLSQTEFETYRPQLATRNLQLLMSHLACANDDHDPKNAEQLARFQRMRAQLPEVSASLCNSSGIFLSNAFHFDLARPGCSLYGITPIEGGNPMRHVATLSAPILQFRTAEQDDTVGYGATYPIHKGTRLATVQLGYADGYSRHLSNAGQAIIAGQRVEVVGRVSMDMLALDITHVPENTLTAGMRAEFISAELPVDEVAEAAGTIGYEVFTAIGPRVRRIYAIS